VRGAGVVLLFLGLVATVVGLFSGCGTLFSWNGRHPIDVTSLTEGKADRRTLEPKAGRRYTVSVQVVFDRETVETREGGVATLEAQFPLVVRVTDPAGTVRAEAAGWLDPNQPPNVLYGQSVRDDAGRKPELMVERLVGPFTASSTAPLAINVELGPDRVGHAGVSERRLVVYDDAIPAKIHKTFVVAGVGALAFIAGAVLLGVGWFRRRRRPRNRGGIPKADVV
jgi:hypothetical protein